MLNLRLWLSFGLFSSLALGAEPPTLAPPAPAASDTAQTLGSAAPEEAPAPPQTAPPQERNPPRIQLHTEPPPPPVARTYHVHDGFYARLNLGMGSLGAVVDSPGTAVNQEGTGKSLSLDLAAGYSPSPGIVVGGMLAHDAALSVDYGSDSQAYQSNTTVTFLGPFFDGYPNSRRGFHLGGALGLAQSRVTDKNLAGFGVASGFGLLAFIGYDVWVAEEWSVGGSLRLMGTRTKADADAVSEIGLTAGRASMETRSIQLMATVLYH